MQSFNLIDEFLGIKVTVPMVLASKTVEFAFEMYEPSSLQKGFQVCDFRLKRRIENSIGDIADALAQEFPCDGGGLGQPT